MHHLARKFGAFGIVIAVCALLIVWTGSAANAEGEQFTGRLVVSQSNEPVEDVKITVTTADGAPVADVTSDKDGRWEVPLPGPGSYTVSLDEDTLPDGVELTNPSGATKTVEALIGFSSAVSFRLTDGSAASSDKDSRFLQLLFEGIRFGLIIAICAIGLSLIYGTTGLVNFAQGEMVAYGAFAAWCVNAAAGTSLLGGMTVGWGAPLWIATIFAIVVGAALGAANELGIWRPLRRRGTTVAAMMIASIGLSIALRSLLLAFWGGDTKFFNVPAETEVDLGPISATPRDLTAIALSVLVLVGVALLLQRTRIGTAMRAVADNRDLAAASGIDVNRVILLVWMLGGALAAFGGVMYGWTLDLRYDMGFSLLLLIFAGVTLGGLGTAYGALLGSLLIGIVVQLSTLVLPNDVKYAAGLGVLILVLLVRPQGLLGTRERIG